MRYVNDLGDGTNTYTWPLDVDGRYAVYARWTAADNRNATADYTVHHAGGTTTVTHDQQIEGAVWKPLGVYDLESAATHKVVLADTGLGVTIADAILLVPMEIESRVVSADAVKLVANDAEDVLTIHADHLGAPQKMTDDTRTVVWDAAFTPFGEEDSIIGAETNNWRFPGQYTDDESGLSYNWHRTYDPAIGRYLQSDPIGLGDGLNTYAYVGSNPVSFVDPTGKAFDTFLDFLFVGYDLYRIFVDNIIGNSCNLEENTTALYADIAAIALPFVTGAGMATRVGRGAERLPDDALVCRGGLCTPGRFERGTGVKVDPDTGILSDVSVQSAPGKSAEDLAKGVKNDKYGVTTVGDVRAAGGDVKPTGSGDHASMSGVTAAQAADLFKPVVKKK